MDPTSAEEAAANGQSVTGLCALGRDRVVVARRDRVGLWPVCPAWSRDSHLRMWPSKFHETVRLLLLTENFGGAHAHADALQGADAVGAGASDALQLWDLPAIAVHIIIRLAARSPYEWIDHGDPAPSAI